MTFVTLPIVAVISERFATVFMKIEWDTLRFLLLLRLSAMHKPLLSRSIR